MKKLEYSLIALFSATMLTVSAIPVYAISENENIVSEETVIFNPVLEEKQIRIENGSVYDLTDRTEAETIKGMKDATIIIEY